MLIKNIFKAIFKKTREDLANEKRQRIIKDTELEAVITEEATTRQSADNTLQNSIQQLSGTINGIPTVQANPIGEATENLGTILIGSTIYKAGSEKHLYMHNLNVTYMGSQSTAYIQLALINDENKVYEKTSNTNNLAEWLYNNGYTNSNKAYACNGIYYVNSTAVQRIVLSIYASNKTTMYAVNINDSNNSPTTGQQIGGTGANADLIDYVVQLI